MIKSMLSNKVEIRQSPIQGNGTFAIKKILNGEIVFIKGGHILTRSEMFSIEKIDNYWPIDDLYVLGAQDAEEYDFVKLFINHSCDPNCGIRGEITCVAMRDIEAGEEVTFDYAMLDNEDNSFQCKCGSELCRKTITGYDWKIPELQKKYSKYFATYLKEKL